MQEESSAITTLRWPTYDVEGGALVHIIGTAHVSKKSCEEVKDAIQQIKPQVVFVELCKARVSILHSNNLHKKELDFSSMLKLLRQGEANLFEILYSWLLSKVGAHLEVMPGEEFRVALAEAKKCGATFVLGDRAVKVTVARTWNAIGILGKLKLLYYLLMAGFSITKEADIAEHIESMKNKDALFELMEEFGETFPEIVGPLIRERDMYMTYHLRAISEKFSPVVAVVGAGHIPGITDNWTKAIDIEEISKMPKKNTNGMLYTSLAIGCTVTVLIAVVKWQRR